MKKIFLLLVILNIQLFSFSQDIIYKNAWGEEVIGPSIEDSIYDGVSRALDDVLEALAKKEKKAALERSKMSLAERAKKVGVSIPSYSLDDPIGRSAFESLITQKERAIYLAEVKKAKEAAAKRDREEMIRSINSNIMNAYDYAKNITLNYKKELGIKKGSGYFKLPRMLFENLGKGKYVRQEGNIQMIYDFTWPGERNIDFADRYKQFERFSNKKMKSGEHWGKITISRKTVYRNTGISATIEWEDEYDIGVRAYYGTEDSNGIDYTVYIESRANKNEASREDVRRVFDYYRPLLEKCIANSNVTVKKLMNETIVLDTEKTKKESKSSSISNSSQKKSSSKEIEVRKLTNTALEKYNNGDLDGAIDDSNKAINIDRRILKSERTTVSPDQTYANRGFYLAQKGEFDKAIEDYNTAIEINPENIFAYHYRGMARESVQDSYDAISDISKAYELNKEIDEYGSNLALNGIKFKLGDTKGAIEGYKLSIPIYPTSAYYHLANIYAEEKMQKEFFEVSDKLMEQPAHQYQLNILHRMIALISNKFKERTSEQNSILIEMANEMIRIGNELGVLPKGSNFNGSAYNILGAAKRDTGDYYGAIAAYTKAIEINPIPENIGGLGTTKLYLGDKIGACKDWTKAISNENISEDSFNHYSKFISENCN